MAMKIETVWAAIDSLLDYAKNCELLHPLDETFARNSLLTELKLESYEKPLELAETNPAIQGYADGVFWERNAGRLPR